MLLAKGDLSPSILAPILAELAAPLPKAEVVTFRGAGRIPHATHPDAYADAITAFVSKNSA